MSCKTCTPATTGFCTNLAATLKTSNVHVKAAWCNDEFLIIAADGNPQFSGGSATEYLKGIPLPPGGDTACRVRTAANQLNVYKIPLSPTKLASGSNSVPNPLPNHPALPAAGAIGVAIDGVPIFPNYNNRGIYTWTSCEVDRCNSHSGKGEDYHYHGDPYGAKCLYSEADYGNSPATAHPSVIGFAFDGFTIYGRYTQAGQEGQGIALDVCGGHTHAPYGYHYHPELETATTTKLDGTSVSGTISYTAYKISPMTCWGGDISKVANFWNSRSSQVNYDSTKDGLSSRNDLTQLKPCCNMTKFYAASGITPSTVAGSGSTTGGGSTKVSGSTGPCSYGTCGSGNDEAGKKCPPDFGNGKPNCPKGCTAVPSAGCSSGGTTTGGTTSGSTGTTGTTPTKPALKDLVLKGALTLTVADADALLNDTVAQNAIRDGIAKTLTVQASQVLLKITKVRRLTAEPRRYQERNLAGTSVTADYTVTVPGTAGAALQATVKNLATNTAASVLNSKIQAEVTKAKGADYTVTVASKSAVTSSYTTAVAPAGASSAMRRSRMAAATSMLVSMMLALF